MIVGALMPNKSLQVTFDPPPIFAVARTGVASNGPELRRSRDASASRERAGADCVHPVALAAEAASRTTGWTGLRPVLPQASLLQNRPKPVSPGPLAAKIRGFYR
ncbi:hypothetical protein C6366_16615 [Desulfonatronum sp. SC1]|nr:hypothetical protein C6366_16615 [Desulfonatronum sp. SC1]